MNRDNIRLSFLAKHCKIKYTSFKDRFDKEKLYASEVEMIAEYFGRPISYYFDQEEKMLSNYPAEENMNLAKEQSLKGLSSAATYQRKVEDLTKKLAVITKELDKVNKRYQR
jgi:hypothetical protein